MATSSNSCGVPSTAPLADKVLKNPLILEKIIGYLSGDSLKAARQVNSTWKDTSRKYFASRTLVKISIFDYYKWGSSIRRLPAFNSRINPPTTGASLSCMENFKLTWPRLQDMGWKGDAKAVWQSSIAQFHLNWGKQIRILRCQIAWGSEIYAFLQYLVGMDNLREVSLTLMDAVMKLKPRKTFKVKLSQVEHLQVNFGGEEDDFDDMEAQHAQIAPIILQAFPGLKGLKVNHRCEGIGFLIAGLPYLKLMPDLLVDYEGDLRKNEEADELGGSGLKFSHLRFVWDSYEDCPTLLNSRNTLRFLQADISNGLTNITFPPLLELQELRLFFGTFGGVVSWDNITRNYNRLVDLAFKDKLPKLTKLKLRALDRREMQIDKLQKILECIILQEPEPCLSLETLELTLDRLDGRMTMSPKMFLGIRKTFPNLKWIILDKVERIDWEEYKGTYGDYCRENISNDPSPSLCPPMEMELELAEQVMLDPLCGEQRRLECEMEWGKEIQAFLQQLTEMDSLREVSMTLMDVQEFQFQNVNDVLEVKVNQLENLKLDFKGAKDGWSDRLLQAYWQIAAILLPAFPRLKTLTIGDGHFRFLLDGRQHFYRMPEMLVDYEGILDIPGKEDGVIAKMAFFGLNFCRLRIRAVSFADTPLLINSKNTLKHLEAIVRNDSKSISFPPLSELATLMLTLGDVDASKPSWQHDSDWSKIRKWKPVLDFDFSYKLPKLRKMVVACKDENQDRKIYQMKRFLESLIAQGEPCLTLETLELDLLDKFDGKMTMCTKTFEGMRKIFPNLKWLETTVDGEKYDWKEFVQEYVECCRKVWE